MSSEQLEKMQQEEMALHQEIMQLEKAESLKNAADKIVVYLQNNADPINTPADNEWVNSGPSSGGCCVIA